MQKVKEFFTSKMAKRFYWQTLGSFLGLFATWLSGIDWIYAPLVIALILGITKEINNYCSE